MKATKTELTRLARLAQKDISRGRVSKNAQKAVEILEDYQNSAIELLDLALEEASKEQSNKPLVDSFGFLFGQALETLRFEIESGYKTASDIAASVRKRLVTASRSGSSDPSILLFLVQCFGIAKLDLGEELRGIVAHLLEEIGEANAGDLNLADPADLSGFVADLVKQADGDPFALHSFLAESSEGVPDEHRAVMAAALLYSGEAAAVEASIGWLLDPAAAVRQSLANALEDAAGKGKVTSTMLRRMITMRNWLPEDSRAALDAAVAVARRKGVSPAQWGDVEVLQFVTTGVDGSGAIGVLAHCRNKRKNVLASLVLKHGIGVRDAWAKEGMKTKEIEQTFFEASLMDQFMIPTDFIRNAVSHFLAVGHQTGSTVPFGLLQFVEAVGLSSVQPELMDATSLLDTIQDGRAISDSELEDLLTKDFDLVDDYEFMDSWFEVGDEVDAALTGSRATRKKREELIIEKVLEPRREWWIQEAAWTAYILYQAGSDESWQEFYAAALAMVQKRPLHEISLMKWVAEQTLMISGDSANGCLKEGFSMRETQLAKNPAKMPLPSRSAGFLRRKLPYIAVLTLAVSGVAYSNMSRQPLIGYWEFLAVASGVLCVVTEWDNARDKQARFQLMWTQALHWVAILVTMNIVLLSGVQRMLPAPATSLVLLTLLALGTFLAGVNLLSLQICFLGLAMALAVPAIAWFKQSALFLVLAAIFLIGLGLAFWPRRTDARAANHTGS